MIRELALSVLTDPKASRHDRELARGRLIKEGDLDIDRLTPSEARQLEVLLEKAMGL